MDVMTVLMVVVIVLAVVIVLMGVVVAGLVRSLRQIMKVKHIENPAKDNSSK